MAEFTSYDAAFPPANPPSTDIVAFYIGGDTPHPWTMAEIQAQHARYRLPIYVRTGTGVTRAQADARECQNAILRRGIPTGVLIALDMETGQDPQYVEEFQRLMAKVDHPVMTYGSRKYVFGNHAEIYWVADWTGEPHMAAGAKMTQYARLNDWDLSIADPALPLWDTRPAPKPAEAPAMPNFVSVTGITSSGFLMSWPAVPGADSYDWRVTYQGVVANFGSTPHTEWDVTGLAPDHTYTVHVAAVNSAGKSAETNGPHVQTSRA